LIDGAQAVPHLKPDMQALDCDFYVFSGHKLCGPTGTGILYGKEEWLNKLPHIKGGGEMIKDVSFEKTTYAESHKFEAGTPNIAGGIALGTAVDYMNEVGFDNIQQQENELLAYGTARLLEIEGLKIYGTAAKLP
jgi:cysteine desulfurase/selenocysteine lyase